MAKNKQKSKIADVRLNTLTQKKKAYESQIHSLQSQIKKLQSQNKSERNEVNEIENSFKRNNISHLRHFNKNYNALKKSIKITSSSTLDKRLSNLKSEISQTKQKLLQTDKEIASRQNELKKQDELIRRAKLIGLPTSQPLAHKPNKPKSKKDNPSSPKFSPLYSPTNEGSILTFEAEWEDLSFADGSISIKHEGHSYIKPVSQSKKYLNSIKHYYKFNNVPKLKIITNGNKIKVIENQEVLFYHIDFLNIAASNFGIIKLDPFQLKNWKKYTKEYYQTKLPFVFQTITLKLLCEYCDPDLPIIPVGEAIINSMGPQTIHNSFLFPLKSDVGNFLVWESIEEKKASYVFSLTSFSDKELQTLFDYIAGDTTNKRETLINSKMLRDSLKMKVRVLHTDLSEWTRKIRLLCK